MEGLLWAISVLGAGEAAVPQIHGAHSSVGDTDIHQLLT